MEKEQIYEELKAELLEAIAEAADRMKIAAEVLSATDREKEFKDAVVCVGQWTRAGVRLSQCGEPKYDTDAAIMCAAIDFLRYIKGGVYREVATEQFMQCARAVYSMITSVYELHCYMGAEDAEESVSE